MNTDKNINADLNHRSFLDVPLGDLIGEEELNLDVAAIGQPGPFDNMAFVADNVEEGDGKTTRTIRFVNQLTQREVARVFAKQPLAPGDNDVAWRRVQ